MTIGNTTEWLADVSRRCRQITQQAVVAVRDAGQEGVHARATLETTQKILEVYLEDLENLLPNDFPPSRLSDLRRHIRFCQPRDCLDIAAFDIPDILEKAEKLVVEDQPNVASGEIGNFLHPKLRERLDREMASALPDYHALVQKASLILGDTFKRKSGAPDDKDSEIGKALKLDAPTIRVMKDLTTETNKNFQRGTMLLMQGVRAFYRNTHAHGEISSTQRHAVHALIIMSMLLEILEHSHVEGS